MELSNTISPSITENLTHFGSTLKHLEESECYTTLEYEWEALELTEDIEESFPVV